MPKPPSLKLPLALMLLSTARAGRSTAHRTLDVEPPATSDSPTASSSSQEPVKPVDGSTP
jgi:hypothetical protein